MNYPAVLFMGTNSDGGLDKLPVEIPIDGTKDIYVYLATLDVTTMFGPGAILNATIYTDMTTQEFMDYMGYMSQVIGLGDTCHHTLD